MKYMKSCRAFAFILIGVFCVACGDVSDVDMAAHGLSAPAADINEKSGACRYPGGGNTISLGRTMPRLWWQSSFDESRVERRFDLHDFHCSSEYDPYSALMVVAVTQSCPACGPYIAGLRAQANALEQAGVKLMFVMLQTDRSYRPTSSESLRMLNRYAGNMDGVRVGSGSTFPNPATVTMAPIITSVPAVFIVRRSDMRLVARRGVDNGFDPIAIGNAAWDGAVIGQPDDEESACADDVDNEQWLDATPLAGTGSIQGLSCEGRETYYLMDQPGRWRLKLKFRNADANIDIALLDPDTGRQLTKPNGRPLQGTSNTNNERISHRGPAIIRVHQRGGGEAGFELKTRSKRRR